MPLKIIVVHESDGAEKASIEEEEIGEVGSMYLNETFNTEGENVAVEYMSIHFLLNDLD